MARLSILIVNWNTSGLLDACLASIRRHPPPAEVTDEVIVVDNDSEDGSADMVAARHPGVRLIRSAENLGFARGNNLALTAATGDLVLLLNPDTELRPETLARALRELSSDPEVGAVGVRQDEPDGTRQASCGHFPGLWTMLAQQALYAAARLGGGAARAAARWLHLPLMPQKRLKPYFDFDATLDVDWVMGAFILLRRTAIPADGLFDPDFVMYGEDLDLCRRIRQGGHKVRYCGAASILHHGGASTRGISVRADAMHAVAMIHLYRKHHPRAAWLYRVLLAGASVALWLRGAVFRDAGARALGAARLKAARRPDWRLFMGPPRDAGMPQNTPASPAGRPRPAAP